MVQMGRIIKAQTMGQERADQITENAKKKMVEAADSFHNTLDVMEIEIVSCALRARASRPGARNLT